jgi:hypothetical protein
MPKQGFNIHQSKTFNTNSLSLRAILTATLLVGSGAKSNEISLIEIIQNYPTPEVEVEGEVLERAYRQLRQLEGNLKDLLIIVANCARVTGSVGLNEPSGKPAITSLAIKASI